MPDLVAVRVVEAVPDALLSEQFVVGVLVHLMLATSALVRLLTVIVFVTLCSPLAGRLKVAFAVSVYVGVAQSG